MNFDYFICMKDNVIVDGENIADHSKHDILGTFFKIRHFKKKLMPGLVSRELIRQAVEKENMRKYEIREEKEMKKKRLAQIRYEKQVPDGAVIINLKGLDTNAS